MANYLIQDSTLTNIADSIRGKTGKSDPILTENMASEIDSITGGEDFLKYASIIQFADLNVFGKKDITLNLDNATDLFALFSKGNQNQTVTHATVNCKQQITSMLRAFNGLAAPDCKMEHLTLNIDTSKVKSFQNMCFRMYALKVIDGIPLDCSSATTFSDAFRLDDIHEIRFKANTIPKSIHFGTCKSLSPDSIQSIIDGLATVEAPQTLTLHPDVKGKLTTEQTQAITAKNWILA